MIKEAKAYEKNIELLVLRTMQEEKVIVVIILVPFRAIRCGNGNAV